MLPTPKAMRIRRGVQDRWLSWSGLRLLAVGLCLTLGLLLTAGAYAAGSSAEDEALACPSGQTTWLRGHSSPGSALLARFNGTLVGGASAGVDGTWAIPLAVRERPGIYPVAVLDRASGATVASFTCYVDLPVGATATASPSPRPTIAPASPTATSLPPTTAPSTTGTRTPTPIASPVETNTGASTSQTATPEPTITPTLESTSTSVTPSPTAPLPGESSAIVLAIIQADDPDDPELFEYALLENTSVAPQPMAGWQLVNTASDERYAIPNATIPGSELLVIWSGDGENDLAIGTLYWPSLTGHWAPGDTAELRDASGRVVSTLVVSAPEPGEE